MESDRKWTWYEKILLHGGGNSLVPINEPFFLLVNSCRRDALTPKQEVQQYTCTTASGDAEH